MLIPSRIAATTRGAPICLLRSIFVQHPHRGEGAGGCNQEESGQQGSLDVPSQESGEIVEHVGAERERQAVDIWSAFARRENRDSRNRGFKNDRDDEHRSQRYGQTLHASMLRSPY